MDITAASEINELCIKNGISEYASAMLRLTVI